MLIRDGAGAESWEELEPEKRLDSRLFFWGVGGASLPLSVVGTRVRPVCPAMGLDAAAEMTM